MIAVIETLKPFLTVNDVAELAGVMPRTVRDWIKTGIAPRGTKVNGRYIFEAEDVVRFLKGENK
ncbi:helix-turn-helix domain-containing protein [Nocardia fluminea]|uniref:helix-turn-helix domain-containing protein n=1 Tax=Nocardia fluminea TaxID=134984 RepID=UPI0033FEC5B7